MSKCGYTDEQIVLVSTLLSIWCQRNCRVPRFLAHCVYYQIFNAGKRSVTYYDWNTSLGGVSLSKVYCNTVPFAIPTSSSMSGPSPDQRRKETMVMLQNWIGTPKNSSEQHVESSEPEVSPNLKPTVIENQEVLQHWITQRKDSSYIPLNLHKNSNFM